MVLGGDRGNGNVYRFQMRPSAIACPMNTGCLISMHCFPGPWLMRFIALILLLIASSAAFAGYELHITRKNHWADVAGPRITESEWQSYVQQDTAIQNDAQNSRDAFIVSTDDGESFSIWYNPRSGELSTKNPSDAAIEIMKKIAARLKAKVQGDDGESYP
ncbi:hypothetical protein [Herbaspirillum huttiense]|uniref:hypothetical protein n=1 Tax=Herbaspirillum huttiense TaxID=863372 RepID=UPI0039AED986